MTRILRLLTLPILLAAAATLSGQPLDIQEYTLDDSVTVVGQRSARVAEYNVSGTRLPLPIRLTPVSVSVVTEALMAEQDARVLGDALRNVAGVNVQTGNGIHDYFILRGFNSLDNGMILTDGILEPEVTFYHTYNVERVEVLRGPGAFAFGGNPLAGAVNLIRKQPHFGTHASLSASGGSYDRFQGMLDAGWGDLNRGVAGRVNGLFSDAGSHRDGMESRVAAVNPALVWKKDDRHHLYVNAEFVLNQFTPDAGIPLAFNPDKQQLDAIAAVDAATSFQPSDDYSDQELGRVRIAYAGHLRPNLTVRNKFFYTDLNWESRSSLLTGAFPAQLAPGTAPVTVVGRTFSELDDRQQLLGNQIEAQYDFRTGGIDHNLVAGFEVHQLSDDFRINFETGTPVLLNDPSTVLPNPLAGTTEYFTEGEGDSRVVAPFLMNRFVFSPRVQLFLGGRFDHITYSDDREDFVQTFSMTTGYQAGVESSSTDRSYSKLSPMAGLVVTPLPELTLFANASQAFAPPSSQVPGEPEAEESTQVEGGFRARFWDGKVAFNAAAFRIEKDNIAIASSDGSGRALGSQESRGVELELFFRPMRGCLWQVGYTYTDAELTRFGEVFFTPNPQPVPGFEYVAFEVDHSGNRPAFVPEHQFHAWWSRQFDMGLGFGLGGRFIGEHYIAPDNVYALESEWLFDAALFYTVGNWRLQLNARNLTDETYYTRGFGQTSVIPAAPFELFGTVGLRL